MRLRLLFVVFVLAPSTVLAAPHGVRLTYAGDPATSVAVSWNSDSAGDGTLVYGLAADALTMSATPAMTVQPSPLNNAFTAKLTGLTPSTTYFYRVGTGATVFQFTTRSDDPCDPFRFILIGDNRGDLDGIPNSLWPEILTETMAHAPDFFVNTGDMVKNGDDPGEWIDFIDDSEAGWALVPSILTMGNHDDDSVDGDSALYNQLYEHPRNPVTGTEDYYSIDIGPIHFVSLNSQHTGSTELMTMAAWAAADLAATTQPWKIVFFHKAIYSRGNHYTGEEVDYSGVLNATLIPVFDMYDVDFVLNGHSHNYERYVPSVGVDAFFGGGGRVFPAGPGSSLPSNVPDGATGTTYMVSGGAGALTTELGPFECIDAGCTWCDPFGLVQNCDESVYDKDVQGTVIYEGRHNFAIFEVDGETITVQVWATDAGNSGGAELVDSFSMTSSADVACASAPMPDAGPGPGNPDASTTPGTPDGGGGNPGTPDASQPQVGVDAGGPGVGGEPAGGCGCRAAGTSGPAWTFATILGLCLAMWRLSRRRDR